MKTEVKKVDGSKREIAVELKGETVTQKFNEAFQKIAKDARVAGFRQGHVPRDILEKNFSTQAHQMVLEELLPDTYNEAIHKEGLDVVELPTITDVRLERDSLSFKATVEIRPQIQLKDYKGIKIHYKPVMVTNEEIKHSIDSLREARKLDAADDSLARRLGYPNLKELERAVEQQIFIQKTNHERQHIEKEVMEKVTQGLEIKVPASMVKRQLEELLRQAKIDLALKGVPHEKIEEQEQELRKNLEAEARKSVEAYLVLSAIAQKENIPLDDHMPAQVMEFLMKEADWRELI